MIHDCSIENSYIEGERNVGGIAGFASNSIIRDCWNHGVAFENAIIISSHGISGGIVGQCFQCSLQRIGVEYGVIEAKGNSNGCIGGLFFDPNPIEQVYCR